MSGFSLVKDPNTTEYEKLRISSQAYTIGDAVQQDTTSDSVDVTPATAATTTTGIYGVAMETVTSSATELLVAIITPEQRWKVAADSTASADHNYQNMLLTDKDSVNNTGTNNTTDEAVFMQTDIIDSSTIVGKFNKVANVTA